MILIAHVLQIRTILSHRQVQGEENQTGQCARVMNPTVSLFNRESEV